MELAAQIEELSRLVEAVKTSEHAAWNLGAALAKAPLVAELEPRILADASKEQRSVLTSGFGAARAGVLGLDWLDALLARLVSSERIDVAACIANGAVDWWTITYRALWDVLERHGGATLKAGVTRALGLAGAPRARRISPNTPSP